MKLFGGHRARLVERLAQRAGQGVGARAERDARRQRDQDQRDSATPHMTEHVGPEEGSSVLRGRARAIADDRRGAFGGLRVDLELVALGEHVRRRGEVAPATGRGLIDGADDRSEGGAEPDAVDDEGEEALLDREEDPEQQREDQADHRAPCSTGEGRPAGRHPARHLLDVPQADADDRDAPDWKPVIGQRVDGSLGG
ncbi:MAG TPA: hypothetical protein VNT54_17440, partial [Solirubrobacteraceae bacterium]|nr:hypothetical protein [Solirubrobacteraceae bacterium]